MKVSKMFVLLSVVIAGLSGAYIGEAPYVEHIVPAEQVFIVDDLPK